MLERERVYVSSVTYEFKNLLIPKPSHFCHCLSKQLGLEQLNKTFASVNFQSTFSSKRNVSCNSPNLGQPCEPKLLTGPCIKEDLPLDTLATSVTVTVHQKFFVKEIKKERNFLTDTKLIEKLAQF